MSSPALGWVPRLTATRRARPTIEMHIHHHERMAAVRGRAKRRDIEYGAPSCLLQGRVSVAARDAAREAADAAGMSIAAYLDALVLADAQHHFLPRTKRFLQEALSA